MANLGMETMMSNSACRWVRVRLPLWVGERGLQSHHESDEGDLAAADCALIERHLVDCGPCRRHRATLDQAMDVLAVAAVNPLVDEPRPSVWPVLEQRIVDHDRSPRPMRIAAQFAELWARRKHGLALGVSVAASVLAAVVAYSVVHSRWLNAHATIVSNRAPVAGPTVPALIGGEEMAAKPELDDRGDSRADSIAQAEPVHSPEHSSSGVETSIAPKQSPVPARRFGYDLDHGTPMPPESRELKPVY